MRSSRMGLPAPCSARVWSLATFMGVWWEAGTSAAAAASSGISPLQYIERVVGLQKKVGIVVKVIGHE